MPVMLFGIVALVVLFVILALVRLWGLRMQTKSGACGGIDLEELKRQRDAGEIAQEEYDAVCAGLADGGPAKAKDAAPGTARTDHAPETPIEKTDAEDSRPERSPADGQE